MKKTILLSISLLAMTFMSCSKEAAVALKSKTYKMDAYKTSGFAGTVTFNELASGGTSIVVYGTGAITGKTYDAHIHANSIAAGPGSIVIDIKNATAIGGVINTSATTSMSYATMIAYDGCFVMHNFDTAPTADPYVMLGNIGKNAQ
jgi:carbon monoxide dehydrogenase subunit G